MVARAKASVNANLDSEGHIFTNNDDYLSSLVSLKRNIMSENSTDRSSKHPGFTSTILGMDMWGSKAQSDFGTDATRSCQARSIDGVSKILLLQASQKLGDMPVCMYTLLYTCKH